MSVDVDPPSPNVGENITITAHVKLDKATTKISFDLVFAAVDHNKFDGYAGATIKAPLGIATVTIPPANCPLVPADDIVFKRYVLTGKHMPKGSTTSKLSGVDQDGEQFICVDMTLDNQVPLEATVAPKYTIDSAANGHYGDPCAPPPTLHHPSPAAPSTPLVHTLPFMPQVLGLRGR